MAPGKALGATSLDLQLHVRIFKPSTSSSHLRLLCSSFRVALGRTQVEDDLSLHHPEKLRAYTPSGQLKTTLKHHHPTPAQLILQGQRKLVVSVHSQSLQLTGLYIPPIDLPTATKAQLQEKGVLSPHKGHTSSTQLG